MKKILWLSVFVAGVLGGIAWSRYHAAHPGFPQLPVAHRSIGDTPPEGTTSMSRKWRKGIRGVGYQTPRVWNYFQRLDASAAPENADTWDASTARHASRGSTLVHRVFDYYRDLLEQQTPTGGWDDQHSALRNIAYVSGSYYNVAGRCYYTIDVWQEGFPPSAANPVCVSITVVPDLLCARTTAEQPDGAVTQEPAPSAAP